MRYEAMNRGILDGGDGLADPHGFIPAGFKPHDRQTFAVTGHAFGSRLKTDAP